MERSSAAVTGFQGNTCDTTRNCRVKLLARNADSKTAGMGQIESSDDGAQDADDAVRANESHDGQAKTVMMKMVVSCWGRCLEGEATA